MIRTPFEYDLINYLNPVNSPVRSLESDSPLVTIIEGNLVPGSLATLASKTELNFKIYIDPSTPPEIEIALRFIFEDGSYSDFQNFTFTSEPDFFEFGDGSLKVRVVGEGSIGFSDTNYEEGSETTFDSKSVMKRRTNDWHER